MSEGVRIIAVNESCHREQFKYEIVHIGMLSRVSEPQATDQSVGFMLSKLGFHTAGGFSMVLEPLALTPPQFAVLRFLGDAEGRSQQAVAEALGTPPSRIVAFVDALEERGLVERHRNPADRRAHALHLTDEGRHVLREGERRAAEFEERICAGLTGAEREQLLALLQRVAASQGIPVGHHPGMRIEGPPLRASTPPPG
jgi:DNA-binding MarR family transcriptional regulator